MSLTSMEFRGHAEVVAEVLKRHEVADGDVCLALVHEPADRAEVVCTTHVPGEDWIGLERHELSQFVCTLAQAFPIPEAWPRRHSIITLAFRRGLTVFGASEGIWLDAWFYSNHFMPAYSGNVILVTEYGWTDFMTGLGGANPALPVHAAGTSRDS